MGTTNDVEIHLYRQQQTKSVTCFCTFCNASPEMRDHLFYLCKYAKEFWEQFEEFWMSIAKQNDSLSLKDIIVGII